MVEFKVDKVEDRINFFNNQVQKIDEKVDQFDYK